MSGLFFFCQRKMNHYKTRKIMNPGFRLVRLVQLFDLFRKATNMVLFCLDKFEDKTHFLIWVLKEENRNLVLEGMRTFIDCIFGKYRDHLYVLQNGFNEVRIEITPVAGQINGWSSLGEQIQESLYEIDEPWGPRSTDILWLNFAEGISIRDCIACLGRRVVLTSAQLFTALEFLDADHIPFDPILRAIHPENRMSCGIWETAPTGPEITNP
jgi:hypothetical protein